MPAVLTRIFILCLIATTAAGQVDGIKNASSSRGSSRGSGENGSSGTDFGYDVFFMFGHLIEWQHHQLDKKQDVPSMVSLDIMLQSAFQPSAYYIVNPRIRGNWGLFSTDFRLNYLVEEGIDGVKYLRTNDWQVLQLNLVNTRDVTFRAGAGMMQESFGGRHSYGEWTGAVQLKPIVRKLGGTFEYRGSEVRTEFNAYVQYHIFSKSKLHTYLTGGAVFQRYYKTIDVWGIQGGIMFSIF
jgi:hypothetical protein